MLHWEKFKFQNFDLVNWIAEDTKKEGSQSSEGPLQVKRRRMLYFGSEDYAAAAAALSNEEISSSILRSQVCDGSFAVELLK